jgi:ACR3 family arsenite transporter
MFPLLVTCCPLVSVAMFSQIHLELWLVVQSVLIYLGIPLVAGFRARTNLVRLTSKTWYEASFLSHTGPFAHMGPPYTILVMVSD